MSDFCLDNGWFLFSLLLLVGSDILERGVGFKYCTILEWEVKVGVCICLRSLIIYGQKMSPIFWLLFGISTSSKRSIYGVLFFSKKSLSYGKRSYFLAKM